MQRSSRAVFGVSLFAYLAADIDQSFALPAGEHSEPIRIPPPITSSSTGSNVGPYNLTITAEDVAQPLKIIGEAPAPDLNFRLIRQINDGKV
jgi:hypothetical protein